MKKFKYKLLTFQTGQDILVYRIKQKGFLGIYWYLTDWGESAKEWHSRESALEYIQENANNQRASMRGKISEETIEA